MKKVLAQLIAVAAVAAVVALPGAAHAEDCVSVPVGSGGFTLEAGGESVRIPAIGSVAVCYELPGTTGIPWVKAEYGGASVVITGGSDDAGHLVLRYVADGSTSEVGAPIPATGGGGGETCLFGVGSPNARPDCAVKLHADELVPSPLPTVPPVPTTGPLPTVPPVPTVGPLPTVPPDLIPTVPPIPDDVCVNTRICLSTLPEIIQELPEIIERLPGIVRDRIEDLIGPCQVDILCI